jgi:hypothetical protein
MKKKIHSAESISAIILCAAEQRVQAAQVLRILLNHYNVKNK